MKRRGCGSPVLHGESDVAHTIAMSANATSHNPAESRRFVKRFCKRPKAPTKRMREALALHHRTVTER